MKLLNYSLYALNFTLMNLMIRFRTPHLEVKTNEEGKKTWYLKHCKSVQKLLKGNLLNVLTVFKFTDFHL